MTIVSEANYCYKNTFVCVCVCVCVVFSNEWCKIDLCLSCSFSGIQQQTAQICKGVVIIA
jgi:hypothetical protein